MNPGIICSSGAWGEMGESTNMSGEYGCGNAAAVAVGENGCSEALTSM